MDFKSLISKIDSIESVEKSPIVLEQSKKVQLDEETAIKFLAGTKTLNEAAEIMKKKNNKSAKSETDKKEEKAESVKNINKPIAELDMNLIKAAQKGQEGKPIGKADPESDKNVRKKYGYRMDGEPAERDDDETKQERRGRKRKNTGESIDTEEFRNEFYALVEAKKKGSKPDFLDVDKDGDKKEPMKKAAKEADKGKDKKETKGLSAKQKKLPPGLQKAIAKKKGKTESVRTTKKVVAESVDMKLTFKDMIKLVQESGGQQQIDPLDKTLFAWATRVAQNKFQESTKAEVYAGLVYERMGGRFEMYDVLAETRK